MEEQQNDIALEQKDREIQAGLKEPDPNMVQKVALTDESRNGLSWFYWIAALTAINAVIVTFGGDFYFYLSLSFSMFLSVLLGFLGSTAKFVALILNLGIAGIFAAFGYFGLRGKPGLVIVGLVLYVIDTLLSLLLGFIGVIIHGYALYCIYKGYVAAKELKRITDDEEFAQQQQMQAQAPKLY